MRNVIIIPLAIALLIWASPILWAAGLSTGFSEVTLENLKIGETYSTKEAAGLPLVVVNTGEEPIDLKIELLAPNTSELKEGFEPIPDLDWIELEETTFNNIQPNEAATTDVTISIPDEALYRGRRYQLFIWSHTVGKTIGVGLKSKLLFTIK